MMVMCNDIAIVITETNGRRSGPSNALFDVEYDNNIIIEE